MLKMAGRPVDHHSGERDPTAANPDQGVDLERRVALAKLGQYAAAGYIAPAMLTLLVSKKASAASGVPPDPPQPPG
jgi:hypothetical protein